MDNIVHDSYIYTLALDIIVCLSDSFKFTLLKPCTLSTNLKNVLYIININPKEWIFNQLL